MKVDTQTAVLFLLPVTLTAPFEQQWPHLILKEPQSLVVGVGGRTDENHAQCQQQACDPSSDMPICETGCHCFEHRMLTPLHVKPGGRDH